MDPEYQNSVLLLKSMSKCYNLSNDRLNFIDGRKHILNLFLNYFIKNLTGSGKNNNLRIRPNPDQPTLLDKYVSLCFEWFVEVNGSPWSEWIVGY